MGQRSLVYTALLLVYFAAMLSSVAGYWLWPNMDGDMERLLGKHGLQGAVPFLDAEGVWGLDTLRMVEESDVERMAQRHTIPLMTQKLLKSKIQSNILVTALAQEVKCKTHTKYTNNRTPQKRCNTFARMRTHMYERYVTQMSLPHVQKLMAARRNGQHREVVRLCMDMTPASTNLDLQDSVRDSVIADSVGVMCIWYIYMHMC